MKAIIFRLIFSKDEQTAIINALWFRGKTLNDSIACKCCTISKQLMS